MNYEIKPKYFDFDKLQEILEDILLNNKDRYDDIFYHKYIINKIRKVADDYSNNTGFHKQEIIGIAQQIIYKELKYNKFKVAKKENLARDFLAKLNSMLYKRINNYNDELRVRDKNLNDDSAINLGNINITQDFLKEKLIEKSFEDKIIDKVDIEMFAENKLSKREKQVLFLIFKEGYTQEEIGDMLGIIHQTVDTYKRRILKKFKKYVSKKG